MKESQPNNPPTTGKPRRRIVRGAALALLGLLVAGAGFGIHQLIGPSRLSAAPDASVALAKSRAADFSLAIKDVAKSIRPAVVTVLSSKKAEKPDRPNRRRPENPGLERFKDFFGEDFFDHFGQGPSQDGPQQWGGSGVIISRDGYVVTNNHVVGKADQLRVQLSDKRSFDAKVVGTDDRSDLAVLKIEGADLPFAELGNSDDLEVGDWVVAIGSPFMLDQTVTAGIVSAKGRAISGDPDKYQDFIQTDAAINQGNSGGPLLNLDGKVVGINTAILSGLGGNWSGIGFAIPSNMATDVKESIIKNGRVVRGWLGVAIQNLTEDLSASFKYKGTEGVLVGQVTEGTPAASAGLQEGDIITSFAGKPVKDVTQLRNRVAATAPGTSVDLEIYRDAKSQKLSAKVGELKPSKEEAAAEKPEEKGELGITVQTVNDEVAERFKLDVKKGVVVTAVEPGSVGAEAGLRPGDLILKVEGENVDDAQAFKKAIKDQDVRKGIRLQVLTQGTRGYVFLKKHN